MLLFCRKKVGVFHHNDTCGHWVVKRAQTARTYQKGMAMELNLLPNGLFMVWFNNFWKFEASVFFVGGGKGWVSEEKGQRLG